MDLPVILLVVVSASVFVMFTRSRRSRLPPGPKGIPLLGNIFDLPKSHEWLAYARWSREYGSDILYLNFVGTPVIILNSAKHVVELFEKRSALYSDRGRAVMLRELIGWIFDLCFKGYGDEWRGHRRMFHQHFNAEALVKYYPQTMRKIHSTLNLLLDTPDDFMAHFRHLAGSIILSVTYGIEIQPKDDPYISIAEEALRAISLCGNVGAHLVDYIPALRYVPSWFPGAGFKRQAEEWRKPTLAMAERPFKAVKRAMADGTAAPSVVSLLLSGLDDTKDNTDRENAIRDMAGSAYAGGADTSVSAVGTLVLAMLLYPEVQRKAQQELDRVVGSDRLPTYDDEPNLPYVTAVFREGMRWGCLAPLALPHRLTRDDEYLGYHLPAGTLVVGNSWAILHDEATYLDPHTFKPERFLTKEGALNPDVPDPANFAFGFGRRICPGRYLAMTSIWLEIASILATFELSIPIDDFGRKIMPSGKYTTGAISYPEPFRCVFRPRSAQAEALIRAHADEMAS